VEKINSEIGVLMENKTVKFRYKNKVMFAFHHSELIKSIGLDASLHELMAAFIGEDPVLFQSINFIMGSEQETHSDSIHMTTYPLGGLVGAWFALDDITSENGPLHYYPGSHKLPYYMNADYDNEGNWFLIGDKSYEAYEAMISEKIKEHGIKKEIFTAQKGDVLLWHANLFHGGEPHRDKTKTRKSMVFHYFRKNSVCYHEITQRPALIKGV
jgi:ectoine hydroxylase-related dioxygenase (phytanoyl-CoA dioxygenase family)